MLATEKLDFVDIATTVALASPARRTGGAPWRRRHLPEAFRNVAAWTREAMVAACGDAGVPLMVHENFRWQSAIQSGRRDPQSGEIGEPFWGRVSFRSAFDVFSGQPYLAEGERFIIEDLGIHILDIARFLFGDVARRDRAHPSRQSGDPRRRRRDHPARPSEGGVTSIVDCSYATRLAVEPFPETLVEVDGSAGSITARPGLSNSW